jgi:hypothetical protein
MNAQSAESLGDFRYGTYEFICRSPKDKALGGAQRGI